MHLQFVVGIQIYVLLHILMLDKHFKSCIPICLCVLVVVFTVLILHEMLPLSVFLQVRLTGIFVMCSENCRRLSGILHA